MSDAIRIGQLIMALEVIHDRAESAFDKDHETQTQELYFIMQDVNRILGR